MTNTADTPFEIEVVVQGILKRLTVYPQETTDGAPYYVCRENQDEVAELRKETSQNWVQLWGELDHASITAIGDAIDKKQVS